MGPVSLRPTAGHGWALKGRPERQRADYNRRQGTRYVFGAYDVHADRLRTRLRPRRRGSDNLAVHDPDPRQLPRPPADLLAPRQPLGELDTRHPQIRANNRIELVATPTYASYLNPVECHFSAISEFVVCNADYLDWDAFAFALARHISYRNGEHRNRRLTAAENRHRIAA